MDRRDVVIIGGGAGGLVVASIASQLGLATTLVEAEPQLGGDCLHYGCVPSKALIQAARMAAQVREAGRFGLDAHLGPVQLDAVMNHVAGVIAELQQHDDPERFRAYGCEVLNGRARFTGPDQIRVGERTLSARRFVLATGSSAFVPPIPGLADAGFLTNREIFSLRRLPARLAVLGGGPIGVELAQAFARLGSRVTVIQRGPRILPREDEDLVLALQQVMQDDGVEFCFNAEVEQVSRQDGARLLHCRSGDAMQQIAADEILVAVGRTPNVQDLGLEEAGVAFDRRGVTVDRHLRSSNRRIYACGDVCGPYQFTHMAEYQAGVVIANALFRLPQKVDYGVVPWVTYSDPELARVGLSEAEAREQGVAVDVLRFDFAANDRAVIERAPQGCVKLLVRRGSRWRGGGRIVGAAILGSHGGELLHEIALAMRSGARIGSVAATIHAYPTRAQILRRAANRRYAGTLFSPLSRMLAGLINRTY
ncbi:MAG: pyridine nucleotide-disulfide oxidoreductase [Gammaproteobacteria bacterium HGW-Gammaproteobacteria-1]|jgi:pyruvate/2-oxoglutarate dehydrogenase complex dihydrolipoamide dehydrogenase (E3) component|nr:MAG: pyridine nucleotide-disulfide oxidoreductase [Gammaproteobacteria bacterium HGW-Gammaproteobacteria-1]